MRLITYAPFILFCINYRYAKMSFLCMENSTDYTVGFSFFVCVFNLTFILIMQKLKHTKGENCYSVNLQPK